MIYYIVRCYDRQDLWIIYALIQYINWVGPALNQSPYPLYIHIYWHIVCIIYIYIVYTCIYNQQPKINPFDVTGIVNTRQNLSNSHNINNLNLFISFLISFWICNYFKRGYNKYWNEYTPQCQYKFQKYKTVINYLVTTFLYEHL